MKKIILTILCSYLLSSCGQMGPLTLPDDEQKDNKESNDGSDTTTVADDKSKQQDNDNLPASTSDNSQNSPTSDNIYI